MALHFYIISSRVGGEANMRKALSRRGFLLSSTVAGWISTRSGIDIMGQSQNAQPKEGMPLVVSSANGITAVEKATAVLKNGGSTLDAVVEGVTLVEDDPEETSVGYGGLPNAEGEVELDASVMYGPAGTAGAVAALKFIRNPAKVARLVMERTNRVFLVGDGALSFALAHGFIKENLLTEKARKAWLKWKEELSDKDDWVAPPKNKDEKESEKSHGTINCLAVDAQGDISGVTSTSGIAFKMPGRVGDSPIIGAGLYVDNQVGAAGSTGNGEANIRVVGAHTVVELMRQGMSPEQACLETLKRVVALYKGEPPNLNFYALNKEREFAAAAIFKGSEFCVHDGKRALKLKSAWLLEKK
jgi:N4-(beta-N-acetylglucosaminyl)-L-asparaginase